MSLSEIEKLQKENKELRNKLNQCSSHIDRFNMIIDNTHEWVWEVDINGVYTYASEQVSSILGYLPEEIIGKTPFDLMSEELEDGRVHFFTRVSPDLVNRDHLYERAIVDVMIKQAGKIESPIW